MDCMELGIQGYMVKPFTHKEISQRILGYYQKTNPEKATSASAFIETIKARAAKSEPEVKTTEAGSAG